MRRRAGPLAGPSRVCSAVRWGRVAPRSQDQASPASAGGSEILIPPGGGARRQRHCPEIRRDFSPHRRPARRPPTALPLRNRLNVHERPTTGRTCCVTPVIGRTTRHVPRRARRSCTLCRTNAGSSTPPTLPQPEPGANQPSAQHRSRRPTPHPDGRGGPHVESRAARDAPAGATRPRTPRDPQL